MDWCSLAGKGYIAFQKEFFLSEMDWYSLADEDVLTGSNRSGLCDR